MPGCDANGILTILTTSPQTRRAFLASGLGAAASVGLTAGGATTGQDLSDDDSDALLTESGQQLRTQYPDLRRHFIFEYYPWYARNPVRHWDQWDRVPPLDLAANTMPMLGAYDSRSVAVLEQHARWIVESGVAAVNLSWWGRDDFEDRVVHLVMDVMHAHDIRVTFHLEPYGPERAEQFPSDVMYLLEEYGEKRRWDCLLFHQWADGSSGPLFKLFNSLVPESLVDCHGGQVALPHYVPRSTWQRVTDQLRETLRHDFDRVTILSESPDAGDVASAGFDGLSIYGPDSAQTNWLDWALEASRKGITFTFNANPGLDEIERRTVEFGSCYQPRSFLPATSGFDWSTRDDRERARELSERQIRETLLTSVLLQTHPWLGNARQGFFLVYICSFNEWHEGHQFEPMRDAAALTPDERVQGYHNPANGAYRLLCLRERLDRLV